MLILAVLREEELYGYRIIQRLQEKSADVLQAGEGSVYPILHAMEKNGYLKSRWAEEGNRPPRKYYRLTLKGQKALEKSSKTWHSYAQAVKSVLSSAAV